MQYEIKVITDNLNSKSSQTLLFAAEELQKYLMMVLNEKFIVTNREKKDDCTKNTIVIGVSLDKRVQDVVNAEIDDAVLIDVDNFNGIITGSNARSVLIAAYRFLREVGFNFIKPGKSGEEIPAKLIKKQVYVCEKPSYRHRGICIEGTNFKEYILDIIDWLPKVSLNAYFIQFRSVKAFVRQWYDENNPYRSKEEITEEEIDKITADAEKEIEKRSLLYHAVGHGWTCDVVGVDGNDWYTFEGEIPEKAREFTAEIGGKRGFFGDKPLNTNLCYSNNKIRKMMVDNIAGYCEKHPEIDYLHFWLADGRNNNCECEKCRGKRPSDYYVQMLNELDEKLKKKSINTKIVFLIYVDLLWKPLFEAFKDTERFVLMFAPITRSFSKSISPDENGCTTPYTLNNLEFPKNVSDNVEYLREWKEIFNGDSFDYDYHFWGGHYLEFSYEKISKVLYEDIKNLEELGLNGMITVPEQRCFLPSSLGMQTLAETLWNKNVDFDAVKTRTYLAEFGEYHEIAANYLKQLSDVNCAEELRGEKPFICPKTFKKLKKAILLTENFRKVAGEIVDKVEDERIKHSWRGLYFHAELQKKMFNLYLNIENEKKEAFIAEIVDFLQKHEEEFKYELDTITLGGRLNFILSQVLEKQQEWDELYGTETD